MYQGRESFKESNRRNQTNANERINGSCQNRLTYRGGVFFELIDDRPYIVTPEDIAQ